MKMILGLFTKNKLFVIAVVICLFPVLGLFQYGLHPTHDGQNQVVRSYEFDKALRDGNWYPLWAGDLNYTYGLPLFNYVYPLPNYTTSFFHLFGLNFIETFKVSLITASILGSIGMYIFASRRFGSWGGLISSISYTYAPYHLLDIYIRGSIGETWALALFPYSLWSLDRILQKKTLNSALFSGLILSLVIFSHNILALMFMVFASLYVLVVLFSKKNQKVNLLLVLSFIVGLFLSAIFWIPALFEQKYVVGLKIFNVLEHFPEVYQLIIPSWGSDYSGQSSATQMSFQIGIANITIMLFVLFGLLRKKLRDKYILFFLTSFCFIVFLMTPYSAFIWSNNPVMQYFQFPWRLLGLVILCTSFLAASLTKIYQSKYVYILLILLIFITTYSYTKVPYFYNRTDEYYKTQENFIYGSNSIGDAFQTAWLPRQTEKPIGQIYENKGDVALITANTTTQNYRSSLRNSGLVVFNTAYFPGWTAYVDNKRADVINESGRIGLYIEKGEKKITLKLEDTPIRYWTKVISVLTFIIIVIILLRASVIQYFYAHRN